MKNYINVKRVYLRTSRKDIQRLDSLYEKL